MGVWEKLTDDNDREGGRQQENYRVPQKKSGICFMIIISIKLNTNLVGMYLICKLGSIAPSGVQKHFCTVSGS